MTQEDRTKKLLYELLYQILEWDKKTKKYPKNMDMVEYDYDGDNDAQLLIEELSKKYDVYFKHQDNEFQDE